MANLFLGFPVPRAKIADMITGTAPPSLHKTQHQDGGTDEIDCTGLAGAGGMANLYDGPGVFISEWFTSITGWGTSIDTNAWATLDRFGLYVGTPATANLSAWIYKLIDIQQTDFSWAKKVSFKLDVKLYRAAASSGVQHIVSGEPGTARHVGFKVDNGVLYGTVGNGTAETLTAAIETLGTGAYTQTRTLECSYRVTSCEFWVDGVLKGTITTGLPTGTSDAGTLIQFVVDNVTFAVMQWIKTSWFKLWKET